MQFTPPLFQKFGSSADDLLKKKLDANEKHEVIVKSQSKNILLTSTMNTQGGSMDKLEGKIQVKYADKDWGECSVDMNTAGKIQKDIKFTKLAPGTTVTGRLEASADSLTNVSPQIAVQYKQDAFAGHAEFISKKKELLTSAAIGYEGFSVGGMLKTDVLKIKDGVEVTQAVSVDGGLQYEDRSMTATFTVESSNTIAFSIFHALNKQTQFAAKLLATTSKGNSIAFATQHTLSSDTMAKAKLHICDDKTWAIATHFEHKVIAPDLTVGVTTFYDSKKSVPAFGVSAQFGNY